MSVPFPPPIVIDGRARVLRLGRKLGQGGEGSVFDVEGEPGLAAKIHHQPLTPLRAEKIRTMAMRRTDKIDRLAAWPTDLLSLPSGAPIGLIMPKVTGHKDIHHVYSPKSRRAEFPGADWRFLIRVATNLSQAVATIHEANGVIADVNHSGVLVSQEAGVRLIDCDSFQIVDGGKTYLCDVGVPTFTPPELQGLLFAEILRTPNHDNFGLAVLIFLTLFMGRHPFAGRYIGLGEMPIERAIGEGRFAYGAECTALQIERPPGAPPLSIVSPAIAGLFERAFARESHAGGRPTAVQWTAALDSLQGQLRQCAFSPIHWHFGGLQACPWCRMEAATGVGLFSATVSPGAAAHFDIDAFWRRVDAVDPLGPAPSLAVPDAKTPLRPALPALRFRQRRSTHRFYALVVAALPLPIGIFVNLPIFARLLFFAAALGLYFVARILVRASNDTTVFAQQARADRDELDRVRDEWQAKAGPARFDAKRAELGRLRVKSEESRDRQDRKQQQQLGDERRGAALDRFLDGFDIETGMPDLLSSRVALLESFGVQTAADITLEKLEAVPKLDKRLREALNDWKTVLEKRFHADPAPASVSLDESLIEREAADERLRIEAALRGGLQDLQEIQKQTLFARVSMKTDVEAVYRAYLQSAADFKAVDR